MAGPESGPDFGDFGPRPQPETATEPIRRAGGEPPLAVEEDDDALLPDADEDPFVPRNRYVMGRSTKVLACIALVVAGMFAGSAVQKQIDAGTRASRGTFGTVQNPNSNSGAGTGSGNGAGTATPGQGRRGGGTTGGGTGGNGVSGTPAAPSGNK